MSVTQKKISVEELAVGMYVSKLDIPWAQSPFPIQGFYIRSTDQLTELAVHCKTVLIDVVKSQPLNKGQRALPRGDRNKAQQPSASNAEEGSKKIDSKPLPIRRNVYPISLPAKKELKAAQKLHQQMKAVLGPLLCKVRAEQRVDVEQCKQVGKEVVESVLRNPDALMWVTQLQQHDDKLYAKSINCLVWALVFGRHLGLEQSRLELLSSAMLLACIGMTRLSKELFSQDTPLDSAQSLEFKKYVNYSVEMLAAKGYGNSALAEVVACQQERHDGSGYPRGLKGDGICLLGKIAGLVGYFDSLLSPLHGQPALTTTEACAEIYGLKGMKFQRELVDEFISAISIYPTGCLVQLTTNEIGIIVSRHEKRKLLPKVLVIIDKNKQKLAKPKVVDLMARNRNRDQFIAIKKSLSYTEWDLDLNEYVFYKEASWLAMVI